MPDAGEPIRLGNRLSQGQTTMNEQRRGYFQNRARQLTSPAFERAILRAFDALRFPQQAVYMNVFGPEDRLWRGLRQK